jgi:uncharacterized protein YlxP (DUF503 family)
MAPSADGGFVGVLEIELHFPDVASLKGKRRELAPVKTWLRGRAGAAVSETGAHDKWQRAVLTAALTGGSPGAVQEMADAIERWLLARFPEGVRVERLLVSVEDLRGL